MPTISSFYGIIIVMRLREKEHNPPHIHAIMQEREASVKLSDGEIMEGSLPPRAKEMVEDFIELYIFRLVCQFTAQTADRSAVDRRKPCCCMDRTSFDPRKLLHCLLRHFV